MSIQELFSNKQYVADELIRMREAWGIKSTFTNKTIEASYKTLGFMRLYAPDEMINCIEAHIHELGMRERMMLFGPGFNLAIEEE